MRILYLGGKNMKKIITILVVWVLFLYGLGAVALNIEDVFHSQLVNSKKSLVSFYDELDQYQTIMTENTGAPIGQIPIPENPINIQVAQSFMPTKDIITRAELFIGKNSTATYPLIVSIRSELIEGDLTSVIIDPSQVPTEEFDWVEIDFDDILITAGQTYYIVALTENTTDNFYGWGANNDSESYPQGCAWFSVDDGLNWTNESASSSSHSVESFINQGEQPTFDGNITWDMCFKIYSRDNNPPSTSDITGPNSGKPGIEYTYCINVSDPDNDSLYVLWDWGDNTTGDWFGPYVSGTEVCDSHAWNKTGIYTISVTIMDEHGGRVTASKEVTMPRDKAISSSPLLRFLERYTLLQTLLMRLSLQ